MSLLYYRVFNDIIDLIRRRTEVRKQRRDELLRQQHRQNAALHPTTGGIHSERMERCKNCCKSLTTFIFSRVGLCLLVVAYAFGGGVLFQSLEAPYEIQVSKSFQRRLNITIERLFNTSVQSKVLYESDWTARARKILEEYQLELVNQTKRGYQGGRLHDDTTMKQWNFPGAILYAITVITTIGYGHITCKTSYGKIMTMIYAIFGIPLMLLCLANIGSTMADAFRFVYCNVCCSYCNLVKKRRNLRALKSVELSHNPSPTVTSATPPNVSSNHIESHPSSNMMEIVDNFNIDYRKTTIPISVTLSLLSSYLILGAVLFSEWENWKFLDGAYFCFVTLATIGLGDLVPGKSITSSQVEGKLVICALYVLFGLSLMAMCFNLMQEEVRAKFRRLGNKLGIVDDPDYW